MEPGLVDRLTHHPLQVHLAPGSIAWQGEKLVVTPPMFSASHDANYGNQSCTVGASEHSQSFALDLQSSQDLSISRSVVKEEQESETGKAQEDEEAKEESEKESSDKESSSEEEERSDWEGDSDDGFLKAAKKPAPKKLKVKAARERAVLMEDFAEYKADAGLVNEAKKPQKRRLDDGSAFCSSAGLPTERRKSARLAEQPENGKKPIGSQVYRTKEYKEYRLAKEQSDNDEEDYQNNEIRERKKNTAYRGVKDPNVGFLMPEDITKSMLDKVGKSRGSEVYKRRVNNQRNGTTCHQCRTRTVDTKTICRSGKCVGLRGQFCGRCLETRYGEDAKEALMNPTWKCPPCRNCCNCTICRKKNGKGATDDDEGGEYHPVRLSQGVVGGTSECVENSGRRG